MMRIAIAIAVLVWVSAAQAQQHSAPAHRQPPAAANAQSKPVAEQRGGERSPASAKPLNTGSSQQETKREWREWISLVLTLITALAAAVLAYVTFRLANYTARLWQATSKLVESGQDTARKELRAYVAVDAVYFVGAEQVPSATDPASGRPLIRYTNQLKIRVRNYGQTPAFGTEIWREASVAKPEDSQYRYKSTKPVVAAQMIHPTQAYATGLLADGEVTSSAQFYTWGQVVYSDIYDRWWKSTWCFSHEGDSRFIPHGDYNKEGGPYRSAEEAREAVV